MENKYQKRANLFFLQKNLHKITSITRELVRFREKLRVKFNQKKTKFISSLTSPGFSADKMGASCLCHEDAHATVFVTSMTSVFFEGEKQLSFVATQSAEGLSRRIKCSKRYGGTFEWAMTVDARKEHENAHFVVFARCATFLATSFVEIHFLSLVLRKEWILITGIVFPFLPSVWRLSFHQLSVNVSFSWVWRTTSSFWCQSISPRWYYRFGLAGYWHKEIILECVFAFPENAQRSSFEVCHKTRQRSTF